MSATDVVATCQACREGFTYQTSSAASRKARKYCDPCFRRLFPGLAKLWDTIKGPGEAVAP